MKNLIHQGKGRKDRYVILSDHLLKELKTYCREFKPTDYLFYGNDKGRMMSDTGMNWILKKVAKKAGIKKHINIRSLRHFFACHHILLGTNLLVLKNLLGHQNIHSTTTYLQVTNQMESSVSNPLDIMYTDSGLIK